MKRNIQGDGPVHWASRASSFAVGTHLLIAFLFTTFLLTGPIGAQSPPCRPVDELAGGILAGSLEWGDLPVEGHYAVDEAALDEGRLRVAVEARLDVATLRARRTPRLGTLCFAVVAEVDGELYLVDERRVEVPELDRAEKLEDVRLLRYALVQELPEATGQLLVVVQEPALSTWGAFVPEATGEAAPRPGPSAVRLGERANAWYEVVRQPRAGGGKDTPSRDIVIRLIPPRDQPATGRSRFDAMATSLLVREVTFELDGVEVESDARRPFVARLELDDPPRVQTVRAIAYDREGRKIGEDVYRVNEVDRPFRVRITAVEPRSDGIDLAAEASLPPGTELEHLEVYRGEELLARFAEPSFQTRLRLGDVQPDDYIRVVATLRSGDTIDDVVLLASPTLTEEVEVNLVEMHVVVTDAERQPVADLGQKDFTVLQGGAPREIASFAYADDVPLLLGLVIDTSGSMQLLIHDTKKAAARFLGQTVLPQDQAFLVDFDRRPRLLQETTDDIVTLMTRLGALQAEGATAMYDAIVFSMLQYERQPGRKALVVLTDGDDRESRYGPKDSIEMAERLGVPIYIIGLGAIDHLRRTYSQRDLERVTSQTGGRLYFVESFEELGLAYAEINAELRSQYTLSFYADDDLTDEERREVRVKIDGKGLAAKTVLGTGRGTP